MPPAPHTWTCRPTFPALPAALLTAALWCAAVPLAHADPKRIYIANDDHTDYFWTADDVQYRAAFLSMLDYYMTQAETTAYRPPDLRGRFNTDGSLWVWEYEHNKTPAQFARLVDHLRAGTITMPLNPAALCYGASPTEAVLRGMYYAGNLERRYDLRFPLVQAPENQTLPAGLASLWAGAGAKYSWRGVCGCATHTAWSNRPREICNFMGPDSTGVVLKWNTRTVGSFWGIGSYAEAYRPTEVVNYLDTNPEFLSRWPWPVSAAFGYGQDNLQTTQDSLLKAAATLSNPNRRVIVSNQLDFFEDFVANHGSQIPTFSGSFGNEWDLYTASLGAVTGAFKRGVEKLRTAEALATLAALINPSFMNGRETARNNAFMAAGLYYEHDWTADGPITRTRRAQFQRDQLASLDAYVNPLYSDGLAALGAAVSHPAGPERHAVFNPLSWARSDAVDLVVSQATPLRIIDVTTGTEVRSQVVGSAPGGKTIVRILAQDVPSVGYRVYEVLAGAGAGFPPAATVTGAVVDNGVYRVTLGTKGEISSLIDHKNADRQLVDASGGGAIHDLGFGTGNVSVESSGPVSVTLKVATNSGIPKHDTRITLFAGLDRVDVVSNVTQNFSSNLAYKSKFALPGAVMRHEELGMVAKVARAAAGGDYADANARTDYLTFNHFVDLSQAAYGITMSNGDSPFFMAGNSTASTLDATTPLVSAVVGMQVDGPDLGIQNQGGDNLFLNRFALRTHGAFDPAAAMRFSLEHQNPLVAAPLTGTSGTLPPGSWSLLTLPSPDVLLWALKPAEEGIAAGVIARTWNLADAPRSFTLALPTQGIASAKKTTHLETDLEAVPVASGQLTQTLRRQQLATWRLMPGFAPPPQPNLAPTIPSLTPNPARDTSQVVVAFRVRELGGVPAPLTRWTLLVDGVTAASGDTAVAASDSVLIQRVLPPRSAGVHIVRVVVDTLGQAAESNETDNAAQRSFLVRESQPPAFTAGPLATPLTTGARIEWLTSEPSSGLIRHGPSLALGDSLPSSSQGTSHADTLTGLSAGVRYYFRVAANDTAGNTAWAPVDSFTIAPPVPQSPEVTMVAPAGPGFFAFGDSIPLQGSGADGDDPPGALRFRWEIDRLRPGQDPVRVFVDSVAASSWVVPVDPDPIGLSYQTRLIVTDPGGLADTASAPLAPEVDLTPSVLLTSPAPAQEGVILICSFWVRNLGRMAAPTTRWVLTLDDLTVAEEDVTLGPLDSISINHTFPPGSLVAGTHLLRIVTDSLAQAHETDETNGVASMTLAIQPSSPPVGVGSGIPHELRLSPPVPNPVTTAVTFVLDLPEAGRVRWRVYDLQGRTVWSEDRERAAGSWTLRWNGLGANGQRAPRGIYVAKIDVAGRSFRRRLVLQ